MGLRDPKGPVEGQPRQIFECTWCAMSERVSQMPASGSLQCSATRSANPAIVRHVSEYNR